MKQKLLSVLSLLAMTLCSSTVWSAELVAPVEPEWTPTSVAPESGKVYYLYNVEPERYLYNYDAKYCGGTTNINSTLAVEMVKTDAGWTMQEVANSAYLSGSSSYVRYDDPLSENSYWNIIETTGGYKIQMTESNSNYSATGYIAYYNNYIYSKRTSSNTWQFIDAEKQERYLVLTKLYNSIQQAKSLNLYVATYENVYLNQSDYTVKQLYETYNGLKAKISITNTNLISKDNEYPMIVGDVIGTWEWPNSTTTTYRRIQLGSGNTASMSAKFYVDKNSVFFYNAYTSNASTYIYVYIDGELVRSLDKGTEANEETRYVEDIAAGEHTIEWRFENHSTSSKYCYVSDLGIMSMDKITVSLLEPGSLGTEVLYNVDGLKDVKNLKVIGKMNSDDWAKIAMMDHIVDLDLSEAVITTVPQKALSYTADGSFAYLHRVVLPEGVTTIENEAFRGSRVEFVNIPTTVKSIGTYAFYGTNIKEVSMPNSVTSIGTYSFACCHRLRDVNLSPAITAISNSAFMKCEALTNCILPEGISSIGEYAFASDVNLIQVFPESLTTIGRNAFEECNNLSANSSNTLVIPSKVSSIGAYAFSNSVGFSKLIIKSSSSIGQYAFTDNTMLNEIELPTNYYDIGFTSPFGGCSNVKKLTLRCPSLVTHSSNTLGITLSKVDLVVPDFLVPNYKLDSYWYNYKTITGFSSDEIQDWVINNPVKLNAKSRLLGTPNISISGSSSRFPSLMIYGDEAQEINNLVFNVYRSSYTNYPGQILCDADNVHVSGNVRTCLHTVAKYWYFFSLPFDVRISEITHSEKDVQKAVRYYDGANRAVNGRSGSWKDFDADAVIPAGTGFIMQTNADTWNYFYAVDNDMKQQCVSNKEFVKTLDVNNSEVASNKGWNLVGNPWQCYYNDHSLNFTGPITVWNVSGKTYTAYSIIDDDYAIRPNEAFFVQCSGEEYNTIGFPTNGRQLTSVIETQNAAKAAGAVADAIQPMRRLINVTISDGETEDLTRVVLNDNAMMDYEMTCDASKFMSMDASVPQIYTIGEDGTRYAINERPVANGEVQLGLFFATNGTHTISLGRCDMQTVYLTDKQTGETVDLTTGNYMFNAKAGEANNRFVLGFGMGEATGVKDMQAEENGNNNNEFFNIAGQRVNGKAKNRIVIRKGVKFVNQ